MNVALSSQLSAWLPQYDEMLVNTCQYLLLHTEKLFVVVYVIILFPNKQ